MWHKVWTPGVETYLSFQISGEAPTTTSGRKEMKHSSFVHAMGNATMNDAAVPKSGLAIWTKQKRWNKWRTWLVNVAWLSWALVILSQAHSLLQWWSVCGYKDIQVQDVESQLNTTRFEWSVLWRWKLSGTRSLMTTMMYLVNCMLSLQYQLGPRCWVVWTLIERRSCRTHWVDCVYFGFFSPHYSFPLEHVQRSITRWCERSTSIYVNNRIKGR